MKIDVLCNDGSPLGVTMKSLWGEDGTIGVGGSELVLLTMCEEWQKAGHTVTLYNNPRETGASPFEQRSIVSFRTDDPRDVLINFRSPNPKTIATSNCLKVWWSTDQFSVGNYAAFAPNVHKIVCISPRHKEFFSQTYGINDSVVIDLPVRIEDYDKLSQIEKIKNRLIFTSVPARGLENLWRIYPHIQAEIPDVSLAITSDYRLWGVGASNEHFKARWFFSRSNVEFFGALPRAKFIEEQLKSQITIYPSDYDELFCVTVAESQYARSYPVTSNTGSLPTTNMGMVLPFDARDSRNDVIYARTVIDLLNNPEELARQQELVYQKAKERFSPAKILEQWDMEVFNA